MSTFGGKIQEIPYISVDRFDKNNFDSDAYFLSHCHTDHMVGLSNCNFQNYLFNNNKYIYASEISCVILKKQYPGLENNLKILDMDLQTTICLKNGTLSVLPISAGHCPGSVMFLFETNETPCILYTGDYRINKDDIRKLKFYDSFKQIKPIEKIYLDTTFFLKSYLNFPTREESLNELCKIIKEWINRGKEYSIILQTSAKYGYEYMFVEICNQIGMPVHVNREVFEMCCIPEMDKTVTLDGSLTQIHCNCVTYNTICHIAAFSAARRIKISALRWTQDNLENNISADEGTLHYVCYSTHASYEEGVELLRFLKPKSVEICVRHGNPDANKEILTLIEEVLDEFRPKREIEFEHKLFEVEENVIEAEVKQENLFGSEYPLLDSPPRYSANKCEKLCIKESSEKVTLDLDETESVSYVSEINLSEIKEETEASPIKKFKQFYL